VAEVTFNLPGRYLQRFFNESWHFRWVLGLCACSRVHQANELSFFKKERSCPHSLCQLVTLWAPRKKLNPPRPSHRIAKAAPLKKRGVWYPPRFCTNPDAQEPNSALAQRFALRSRLTKPPVKVTTYIPGQSANNLGRNTRIVCWCARPREGSAPDVRYHIRSPGTLDGAAPGVDNRQAGSLRNYVGRKSSPQKKHSS